MAETTYGTLIRTAREAAHMTQDDLADRLGISTTTVSNWERAVRPPGLSIVDRYHRSLSGVPEYIVGGRKGKLLAGGVYWAVRRAFEAAGIDRTIGAHDLRHTSATHAAATGEISETDAMEKFGWKTADMWRHYSAQARRSASLNAQRRNSPMERLQ